MSVGEYVHDQAARIRCLRDYLGLSVNEMAAALSVSPRAYQNFESGRFAIPAGVMTDVADLVARLDELAGEYAEQDTVRLPDDGCRFQLRAMGIAAAARPGLKILP